MDYNSERMTGSSMSYSKAIEMVAAKYDVSSSVPGWPHGSRSDALMMIIDRAVKLNCERAAREAAFRIYRQVAERIGVEGGQDMYFPECEIRISTAKLGLIKLPSWNTSRE